MSMHFVATFAEARRFVDEATQFWVSECGCRKSKGRCAQSRHDICLSFDGFASDEASLRTIDKAAAMALLHEAEQAKLVVRPWYDQTRTSANGICFCCSDCCGYFLDGDESCDKGKQVEYTDAENCTNCGDCVPICHFDARSMSECNLKLRNDSCYGCGLCVNECPTGCIEMRQR